MLGDAIGATGGTLPASGPLRATSAGQLACFTVDGLIRAHIGGMHRGLTHPPGMIWYAYNRWAVLQGIAGVKPAYGSNPPAGWLAEVPVLRERRGSAEGRDGHGGTAFRTEVGLIPAGTCSHPRSPQRTPGPPTRRS